MFQVSSTNETFLRLISIWCFDHSRSRLLTRYRWRHRLFRQNTPKRPEYKNWGSMRSSLSNEITNWWNYTTRLCSWTQASSLSSCHKPCEQLLSFFQKRSSCIRQSCQKQPFFKPVGSEIAWLRNGKGNQTTAFKMASSGHYHIDITAHAFKEYICDWIGLVNDCYILYISTFDNWPPAFNPDFS